MRRVASILLLLAACVAVQRTAETTLACPKEQVSLVELDNGWVANGCGHSAICDCFRFHCTCCPREGRVGALAMADRALRDEDWFNLQPRAIRNTLGLTRYYLRDRPEPDTEAPFCSLAPSLPVAAPAEAKAAALPVRPPDTRGRASSLSAAAAGPLGCEPDKISGTTLASGAVAFGCGRYAICDCHRWDCVCCAMDFQSSRADLCRGQLSARDWNTLHIRKPRHAGGPECQGEI